MKLPPLSIGGSQNKVASDPETETVRFLGIPGPRVAMVVVVGGAVVVGDGKALLGSIKRSRLGELELAPRTTPAVERPSKRAETSPG
jgi:hypothetical protein